MPPLLLPEDEEDVADGEVENEISEGFRGIVDMGRKVEVGCSAWTIFHTISAKGVSTPADPCRTSLFLVDSMLLPELPSLEHRIPHYFVSFTDYYKYINVKDNGQQYSYYIPLVHRQITTL